ncbi:5,6-dimethylbenzimidazole synthase [Skermania sp. ID1734]|uniref:5,6-dimethylbenzimidazole synthase n=1 Tax=Skermania sp. ID1734 TaxID=2597516 RepID=UPI00117C75E4|nr:5,6-dimethylbenzimidazole synthase [Skermania sp. ID1734]TSE00682.1 5,6-dimethylbenzimidazole synthase [Skermania sp. ID1734]
MSVFEAIGRRRDVRAEFSGALIDDATLERLLAAAHSAPSVGNSQPWDFIVVQDPNRLREFAIHVSGQRQKFADTLPDERARTFDPIKIDGIVESGTGIVVTYNHGRGGPHILGRHTIGETGLYSVILAISNLWLAATALGVGVGWVSFYEEDYLAELAGLPEGIRPVAYLCVGPVKQLQTTPDLERFGWRTGRPLSSAVHRERFSSTA